MDDNKVESICEGGLTPVTAVTGVRPLSDSLWRTAFVEADAPAKKGRKIDSLSSAKTAPAASIGEVEEQRAVEEEVALLGARRSHVFNALRRRGLRCWPIGRHHLVTATRDRAESLLTLKALWRDAWGEPPCIVGCGNSEDDVAWLRYADVAVIVQNDHAGVDRRLLSKLSAARVSPRPGRLGWSDAIFEVVDL